jgi:hypothetical protein
MAKANILVAVELVVKVRLLAGAETDSKEGTLCPFQIQPSLTPLAADIC